MEKLILSLKQKKTKQKRTETMLKIPLFALKSGDKFSTFFAHVLRQGN